MAGKAELDATYEAKDYYQDDWTFLNLRPLRQQMAERLAASIAGRPIPDLQIFPAPSQRPDKTATLLLRYISECLRDPVLPIEERVRLFIWLTGRYLRHQKYLPAKKPSRKAIQEPNIF
jgi:broad specificity phosphatase PhoE